MTGPSPQDPVDPRFSILIFFLLLLTINLFIFLPSMSGDFLWDDKYFISENPTILGSRFLDDFWRSPFGGFSGTDDNSIRIDRGRQFFRPLTSLSYWLDFKIWGLNPAAFHLTNILLQAVNSVLLLFILFRLGLGPAVAFSGALLFSVFPLHFENVAWISGRTDLLSFLFAALSVLSFLAFLKKRRRVWLVLSALNFLGGLLAKENVILLPCLFLLVLWRRGTKARDLLLVSGPFVLSVALWFFLRAMAFGNGAPALSGRSILDFFSTLGFYTLRLVIPFGLTVTVDSVSVFANPVYMVLGGLIAGLFAVSIILLLDRKRKMIDAPFLLAAAVLFMLPSIAVIFSSLSLSLVAWRFLYLPSAVFVAGLAHFSFRLVRPRAVAYTFLGLLAVAYAVETYPKSGLFGRDETGFWLGIKRVDREDLIARFNIAIKTLPQDEKKALQIFDRILAAKTHPLYSIWQARIYEELAIYYAFQRDFTKAEYYFGELSSRPGGQSLHSTFNYSYYLAFAGKREEGERIVLGLVGRYPQNHFVLTRAAKFYLIVEDYPRAADLYGRDYELFRNEQTKKLLEELRPLIPRIDQ
ncbi:MAG: glycosyltransferase family 39 protein [Candidatus Aminicenantales bacterium]